MIGTSYFIGIFVGSFLVPISDKIGRKPIFLFGMFMMVVEYSGIFLSKKLNMLYLFLLLGGIGETGRFNVAYVYTLEIFPVRL